MDFSIQAMVCCSLHPQHHSSLLFPASSLVFKGVEITLTTWWHQMTEEERFECFLSIFVCFVSGGSRMLSLHLEKHGEDGLNTDF